MKLNLKHFSNLDSVLKGLEPYVRGREHLYKGRPFDRLGGLRSREILLNWLLCAVLNDGRPTKPFTFSGDTQGDDGIICDRYARVGYPTEHVMVPVATATETRDIARLIEDAVSNKQAKGPAYARGKILVVFLDAGLGEWHPNRVARQLPKVDFDGVWVAGLHSVVDDEYIYGVTHLNLSGGDSPICLVRIGKNFDEWSVERKQ